MKFEMFGNKSKSDKAQKKATKSDEQFFNKQTDTKLKSKADSGVTSDSGAHNIYYKEKKDMEHHTYYTERRTLTEAKIKQDSYSEVKQYYSRKDTNVGTGIPRVREFTPRKDLVITTTHGEINQGVAQAGNESPPDYDSLFSGQQDGKPPS